MITINDSCRHIRYNVWIDDIPSIYSKYLDVLEEDIIKDKWIKWESVSYVIEMRVAGRHASNYALLGLSYKYEKCNSLKIKVKSSDSDGEIFKSNFKYLSDEIHAGIPIEYSDKVVEVAKKYLNEIPCSPGTITFDIGAHGYVGSSSVIFGTVTELLLKLLSNNRKNDTKGIEKILIN